MADDVFDDNDANDDDEQLLLASREYEKNLQSIEKSAFHDGYDEANEKSVQKSFDYGYEVAFKYFDQVGQLKGFADVLLYQSKDDGEINEKLKPIQVKISELYSKLIDDLNVDIKDKLNEILEDKMLEKIKPSKELKKDFDQIKAELISVAISMNFLSINDKLNEIKLSIKS